MITPYEKWTKKKPDLSHIRIFGCDAYAHISDNLRKKWDEKSKNLIFVGYNKESSNYRLLNLQTGSITVSRHAMFNENVENKQSEVGVSIPIPFDRNLAAVENADDVIELERSILSDFDDFVDASDESSEQSNDPNNEVSGVLSEQNGAQIDLEIEPSRYSLRSRENLKPPDRYATYTS